MTSSGAEEQIPYGCVVRIGGALAASAGGIALIGWGLGLSFLASLGPDKIPMAASTALLFVLYGVATVLRARLPLHRSVYWLGVVVHGAGALVAVLLFCLSYRGIYLDVENLGFAAGGVVDGAPIGHMSPVAALCFLLASLSFLTSLPRVSNRRWPGVMAWGCACLLLAVCSVLLLAYLYGTPLLYGGTFIPPAATTCLAFAALGVALLALAGPPAWPLEKSSTSSTSPAPVLILIFLLLAAGSITAGYLYSRSYVGRYRTEVERGLSSVAQLKVSELMLYRRERFGDGSIFLRNAAFFALVQRFFDNQADAEAQGYLQAWLGKYQKHFGYDLVSLLDAQGTVRISFPQAAVPIASEVAQRLAEVMRSGQMVLQDFHRNEHDRRVYLTMLVPILDEVGARPAIGALILRIDPETHLYPFISRWPMPSETAETVLVRRDGNDVLYLNEVRFKSATALALRIPLTQQDAPSVKAVLGREGIVDGVDYRGVPVIADVRPIPDSPWFLVTQIAASEEYAPLRERTWMTVLLIGILLAGAGAGVGGAWRRQQAGFYRERYKAERERAWLQDVIARSLNEVYVFDPETLRFSFANTGACRNLGYTAAELAGLTPLDIQPAFAEEHFRALLQPLRTGEREVFIFETVQRRKDGSEYPVEVHLQHLDAGGGPVFLAIIGDLTERKRAEARLRLQSTALDAAANAMVITDREGVIEWVNPAFTRLSGHALEEAIGKNPRDLVRSGQHDQAFYKHLWDTILAGQVWRGELINRRKDGSLYTEAQTITPVRDEKGDIRHFIAIKENITERLQLEAQFRQAQKMEAVGRLAGGIAHDFNNQIFVINGYCDLLLGEAAGQPAVLEPLAEIKKAAHRSAELTAQLLAFSRKQVLQPKVLDINVELLEVEMMLRRLIGEDLQLTFMLAEDVGHVKVDPNQLQQVVMNLVVNARDAMPHGGQLTIETNNVELDEAYAQSRLEVRPGAYVLLSVSDTGHGMDRETLARIFEPFFTTKGPGKGTGLGLATALGIVKQSGGHIAAYSEPGGGTTFKIYLPRVDEPVEVTQRRVTEELVGGSETILLVEDEATVRELVRRVLAERGYQVLPAAGGKEALRLAERCDGPIHLLLTDVVMPEMSGSQLAARLTAMHPETRVIYMSGYTENAIVHHGVLKAGLAFLPKPCPTDVLVRKVREILDARPRKDLRGSRILVVDDSEDERILQARVLSKAGCVVLEAADGTEALGVLEREAVDAVITDVNMPGMDGFALTETIRRTPRLRTLPVIILSGAGSEEEQERSRAVGATACLSKGTTDQQGLLDILSNLL
jgi:PAS domain S-box-containing protein